jgi:hypothetical protein
MDAAQLGRNADEVKDSAAAGSSRRGATAEPRRALVDS